MLSRLRLSRRSKAAAAVTLLLVSFTACQHTQTHSTSSTSVVTNRPPRVNYSKTYDPEIKAILTLANQGRWEEAQAKATALHEEAPKNPIVALGPVRAKRRLAR